MSLFQEELDEMKKRLGAAGVTPEMAQVAAAQPKAVAQESLLPVPQSPIEKMMERDGKFATMGKMLLGGFTGMTPFLMPELIGSKARYAQELEDYSEQQKLLQAQKMAEQYQGLLFDDDPDNDVKALQMGAIYQPDIYEPVLRDRLQRKLNPTEETMFAPDFQYNPEIKQWEMLQTGDRGTTTRTAMGEGWKPESRMPSADYLDKSIGEADQRQTKAMTGASEADWILGEMEKIGAENWTSGLKAEGSELYKKITGTGDIVTSIRKEYESVRVRGAVQNLPPGVASDKDIALVLEPWPEGTDNYDLIKRKLEAISRIERGRAEYARFESEYISQNGGRNGLQRAWDESETAKSVNEANNSNRSSIEAEFNSLWGD